MGAINEDAAGILDGVEPRLEGDEYVQIINRGESPQNMEEWVLRDIADGTPSFTFSAKVLSSGEMIRVYTNESHPQSGGFSFGSGRSIWNNSDPDKAGLFNSEGREVSRKSYPPGCP